MKIELLQILRSPKSGQRLNLENKTYEDLEIDENWLISDDGLEKYLIKSSIPRFVPQSNYADNFGMQWETI